MGWAGVGGRVIGGQEGDYVGGSGSSEQDRVKWVGLAPAGGAEVRWAGQHRGQSSYQVLQELLGGVEFQGAWRPHVLCVVQISDGEVEGERQQGWSRGCSRRGREKATLSEA